MYIYIYIYMYIHIHTHTHTHNYTPSQAIGGICYRPYYKERLGEVAFCAIKTDQQVRGYGTRLMNQVCVCDRESDIERMRVCVCEREIWGKGYGI